MEFGFPKIDIVTVNYNGLPFLGNFFKALGELDYPKEKMRLFFVDNNSRDESLDFARGIKTGFEIEVIKNDKNYGFAKANNIAFARSSAEYVAILNNDTRVDKNWLRALVLKMQSSSGIGMASSKRVPEEAPRAIDPVTFETSWCSGGHSLIRKAALDKTGYFDERFFMYGEDVDLSWRMWLGGYKCIYVPESICEHHSQGEPDKSYRMKSVYFHARNSILLRYEYGSFTDALRQYLKWAREAMSLCFKKFKFRESMAVSLALLGHLPYIPYFISRGRALKLSKNFKGIKEKWITL